MFFPQVSSPQTQGKVGHETPHYVHVLDLEGKTTRVVWRREDRKYLPTDGEDLLLVVAANSFVRKYQVKGTIIFVHTIIISFIIEDHIKYS